MVSPAKSPAQIPAGKCEITQAGLGMESNLSPQFNGTTLYNLALSFLLTAGHDTYGCRKNGI